MGWKGDLFAWEIKRHVMRNGISHTLRHFTYIKGEKNNHAFIFFSTDQRSGNKRQ